MKTKEEKVVSPFEFAIRQAANDSEGYRPETEQEKKERLERKFQDFFSRIKVKR